MTRLRASTMAWITWQPLHRLAVYDRNIDWFAFWLRGYEDLSAEKREQYDRRKQLRATVSKHNQSNGDPEGG
jgi:hypothetical protein